MAQGKIGDLKLQLAIAREVIESLNLAQEARVQSAAVRRLRTSFRSKILEMAAINKIRMWQRASLNTIRLGDASTHLFHLRANGRRMKIFIQNLHTLEVFMITHDEKEATFSEHFK